MSVTPGAENSCGGGGPVPLEVKIHEVQGNGSASPLVDTLVAIEGIVVGDFQDGASGVNGDLNGFHVQEEDADADADALTSEGIFVYDGSSPAVNVQIGDLVQVEGVVSEFNDLTEITSFSGVTVVSSGNPIPTAASVALPVNAVSDFEAYEGMLVTFPQALVISEYFNFDRFGEIVLTSERHLTPTAEFEPGSPDASTGDTGLSARQDHARRWAYKSEPRPCHPSEWRRLRPDQFVPRRRHGYKCDRCHGLCLWPLPHSAYAGRGLHKYKPAYGFP